MLMAIGIGLAAGTQLTTVAYLASLVFVAISLGVWKSNFGTQPAVLSGWRIDNSEKLGKASGESATTTENRYTVQIEVHTTEVETAQKATALILKYSAKEWQVADVIKNADGTAIVVFDVRLKKSVTLPTVIQDIEESGKGCMNEVRTREGMVAHEKSRK